MILFKGAFHQSLAAINGEFFRYLNFMPLLCFSKVDYKNVGKFRKILFEKECGRVIWWA